MICKNCNTQITHNYCSECGQAASLKRIDRAYIQNEVSSLLYFEKGLFYTFKELLLHPGSSINKYLTQDRNRLVKPVIYIIVTSIIYTLLNKYLVFDQGYINYTNSETEFGVEVFKWLDENYGYANIVMGFFIALWVKLLFKKKYNYFEICTALFYIMGETMLLLALFLSLGKIINIDLSVLTGIITLVYISWGLGQVFAERKAFSYIKAIIAYILGTCTFIFFLMLLGLVRELLF